MFKYLDKQNRSLRSNILRILGTLRFLDVILFGCDSLVVCASGRRSPGFDAYCIEEEPCERLWSTFGAKCPPPSVALRKVTICMTAYNQKVKSCLNIWTNRIETFGKTF
ncbi:hypothetical protein AVEN_154646-1 [Araneus ventricosus]|uniref:Uncharacterized protein n=1 Tax=Araneus ventricosus TaxID=182803 RepID=A0A4Y2JNJ9_ARAVE|nr:hypothetical protein AVEN_154646-1 [Araneus ventricosus]